MATRIIFLWNLDLSLCELSKSSYKSVQLIIKFYFDIVNVIWLAQERQYFASIFVMFRQWFKLNKDLSIALYFTKDMFRLEENWVESTEKTFCTK